MRPSTTTLICAADPSSPPLNPMPPPPQHFPVTSAHPGGQPRRHEIGRPRRMQKLEHPTPCDPTHTLHPAVRPASNSVRFRVLLSSQQSLPMPLQINRPGARVQSATTISCPAPAQPLEILANANIFTCSSKELGPRMIECLIVSSPHRFRLRVPRAYTVVSLP
jgi:hypothetical protein